MEYTLGLDIGVASIGYALVTNHETNQKIEHMGCRIIPHLKDDKEEFTKGQAISKNQSRTIKRTQRKLYDRYQLRRSQLKEMLTELNMLPDESLIQLPPLKLYELRAGAVSTKISLAELGRVLLHLNQKRGYSSSRASDADDKKKREYVQTVFGRHKQLREAGLTVGQHLYAGLMANRYYRTKDQVFPRDAYKEEFDAIFAEQQKHYPETLTPVVIGKLRNEIIYYQRQLKSQKHLVSVCELEGREYSNKAGIPTFGGPKVAPRSSPIFQICKIWESINNLIITNKRGYRLEITREQRQQLFDFLDNNDKLTKAKLFELLQLKADDGWQVKKNVEKGLQGNLTKTGLKALLRNRPDLLQFELTISKSQEQTFLVDKKTGEVTATVDKKVAVAEIEQQPLYQLWHVIYSIADAEDCAKALTEIFNIDREVSLKLAQIDFKKSGFGDKSARAMRKILPYLMDGFVYSDAAMFAGYNHSNYLTADERQSKTYKSSLELLKKNSIRQPVVEKILNQLVNLVNAIIAEYGKPTEIRVELARELKQSREEREESTKFNNQRERENNQIIERIEKEHKNLGVSANRKTIIKWRLYHEMNDDKVKANPICIYCGKPYGITDALKGAEVDVDHIIPQSRLFDDSQSNKVLVHRSCNATKSDQTAYDFMSAKGETALNNYIERVHSMYKNKVIGKAKRDKLLMTRNKIPQDFIDRQLRETAYISRKAIALLEEICPNVHTSSGQVTERLRRLWGWDDVLMNLQLPKYRALGLTQQKEWETNDGQKHTKEIIKEWSKRDDHRHHAIDALVVACTKQGYIQRINTLNAQRTRDEMTKVVTDANQVFKDKLNLLDKYLLLQRPFSTRVVEQAAEQILVSFKAGKRVATLGVRKVTKDGKTMVVQRGIVVPRGPLSEEFVYGKIKAIAREKGIEGQSSGAIKQPLKYLFHNPELIANQPIKRLVEQRLQEHDGSSREALASVAKNPIFLDDAKTQKLEYGSCYEEKYVIKYKIAEIKQNDIDFIVDEHVKEIIRHRYEQFAGKEKEAMKDLENNPIWFNEALKIPIRTVRCFTGLSAVEPVKKDENGQDIGFVKPGNNHHIAIYLNEHGEKHEHICSFWHAVERKKYGIPIIINDTANLWEQILQKKESYPESFLSKLPNDNMTLHLSMQQNEMFVLGMTEEEFKIAVFSDNKKPISDNLYAVRSVSENDYVFLHHTITKIDKSNTSRLAKNVYRVRGINALYALFPQKIRITTLGKLMVGTLAS
jgi:CRISPR-associated endonuclease Csn1